MPVKIRRPEFVAALASTATSAADDDKICGEPIRLIGATDAT
jgi:hypothetical protein